MYHNVKYYQIEFSIFLNFTKWSHLECILWHLRPLVYIRDVKFIHRAVC